MPKVQIPEEKNKEVNESWYMIRAYLDQAQYAESELKSDIQLRPIIKTLQEKLEILLTFNNNEAIELDPAILAVITTEINNKALPIVKTLWRAIQVSQLNPLKETMHLAVNEYFSQLIENKNRELDEDILISINNAYVEAYNKGYSPITQALPKNVIDTAGLRTCLIIIESFAIIFANVSELNSITLAARLSSISTAQPSMTTSSRRNTARLSRQDFLDLDRRLAQLGNSSTVTDHGNQNTNSVGAAAGSRGIYAGISPHHDDHSIPQNLTKAAVAPAAVSTAVTAAGATAPSAAEAANKRGYVTLNPNAARTGNTTSQASSATAATALTSLVNLNVNNASDWVKYWAEFDICLGSNDAKVQSNRENAHKAAAAKFSFTTSSRTLITSDFSKKINDIDLKLPYSTLKEYKNNLAEGVTNRYRKEDAYNSSMAELGAKTNRMIVDDYTNEKVIAAINTLLVKIKNFKEADDFRIVFNKVTELADKIKKLNETPLLNLNSIVGLLNDELIKSLAQFSFLANKLVAALADKENKAAREEVNAATRAATATTTTTGLDVGSILIKVTQWMTKYTPHFQELEKSIHEGTPIEESTAIHAAKISILEKTTTFNNQMRRQNILDIIEKLKESSYLKALPKTRLKSSKEQKSADINEKMNTLITDIEKYYVLDKPVSTPIDTQVKNLIEMYIEKIMQRERKSKNIDATKRNSLINNLDRLVEIASCLTPNYKVEVSEDQKAVLAKVRDKLDTTSPVFTALNGFILKAKVVPPAAPTPALATSAPAALSTPKSDAPSDLEQPKASPQPLSSNPATAAVTAATARANVGGNVPRSTTQQYMQMPVPTSHLTQSLSPAPTLSVEDRLKTLREKSEARKRLIESNNDAAAHALTHANIGSVFHSAALLNLLDKKEEHKPDLSKSAPTLHLKK